MKGPSHLVIDGYNVICSLQRFAKLRSLEEKRDSLQRSVELFAQAEGMDWTICFDGRKLEGVLPQDPHLVFSQGEGADAVIERLAYQARGKERLLCVTNDRTLRNFLFGLDVSILSVDEFEQRIQKVEQAFGF